MNSITQTELQALFDIIGTPHWADVEAIKSPAWRKYLQRLPGKAPTLYRCLCPYTLQWDAVSAVQYSPQQPGGPYGIPYGISSILLCGFAYLSLQFSASCYTEAYTVYSTAELVQAPQHLSKTMANLDYLVTYFSMVTFDCWGSTGCQQTNA